MIHIVGLILKIIGIVLLVILFVFLFCLVMLLSISAKYHGSIKVKEEAEGKLVVNAPLLLYRLKVEFKDGSLQYKFRVFGFPVIKSGKEEKKKKVIKKVKKKKPKGFFAKIKYTFDKFCVKIKKTWNNSKELKRLLEKDITKEALLDLKKEAGFFLRLFKPEKLKGYVEFGTGDPASTGQILGIISIFYFSLFPEIVLRPLFEEKRFSAELFVKGRLSLWKMLGCLMRLYGNRKIKYVYKQIINLGGSKYVREE